MPALTLTNTDRGDRGVNTLDGFVSIAPGQTQTVELSDAEADDLPAYFAVGERVDSPREPESDGLDDMTVGELDKIVEAEGVKLPEGRAVKADKVAAIRAHRAAPPAPGDGLDDMDDATLRNTVQAITGAEPPADADRAALLALARGE